MWVAPRSIIDRTVPSTPRTAPTSWPFASIAARHREKMAEQLVGAVDQVDLHRSERYLFPNARPDKDHEFVELPSWRHADPLNLSRSSDLLEGKGNSLRPSIGE